MRGGRLNPGGSGKSNHIDRITLNGVFLDPDLLHLQHQLCAASTTEWICVKNGAETLVLPGRRVENEIQRFMKLLLWICQILFVLLDGPAEVILILICHWCSVPVVTDTGEDPRVSCRSGYLPFQGSKDQFPSHTHLARSVATCLDQSLVGT